MKPLKINSKSGPKKQTKKLFTKSVKFEKQKNGSLFWSLSYGIYFKTNHKNLKSTPWWWILVNFKILHNTACLVKTWFWTFWFFEEIVFNLKYCLLKLKFLKRLKIDPSKTKFKKRKNPPLIWKLIHGDIFWNVKQKIAFPYLVTNFVQL